MGNNANLTQLLEALADQFAEVDLDQPVDQQEDYEEGAE